MRRLYLIAAVFAVACGAPPTGVETELVGGDASLMARKGPKSSAKKQGGPRSDGQDEIVFCAEADADTPCPSTTLPSSPVFIQR